MTVDTEALWCRITHHALRSFPRKRESRARNWVPAFAGTSGVPIGEHPMAASDYEVFDERFRNCVNRTSHVQQLWTGARWTEGPVCFPGGKYVLFSDIPNDRIMRYDETDGSVSVFRSPCGYSNGHTVDRQGRLVSCEHGGRGVSRTGNGCW